MRFGWISRFMLKCGGLRIGTGRGLSGSSRRFWMIGTCCASSSRISLIRVADEPGELLRRAAEAPRGRTRQDPGDGHGGRRSSSGGGTSGASRGMRSLMTDSWRVAEARGCGSLIGMVLLDELAGARGTPSMVGFAGGDRPGEGSRGPSRPVSRGSGKGRDQPRLEARRRRAKATATAPPIAVRAIEPGSGTRVDRRRSGRPPRC